MFIVKLGISYNHVSGVGPCFVLGSLVDDEFLQPVEGRDQGYVLPSTSRRRRQNELWKRDFIYKRIRRRPDTKSHRCVKIFTELGSSSVVVRRNYKRERDLGKMRKGDRFVFG